MKFSRRRTDHLLPPEGLPSDPAARGRVACDAVIDAGFDSAIALHVTGRDRQAEICAAAGQAEGLADVARGLAERVALTGESLNLSDNPDGDLRLRWRFAAMPCGTVKDGSIVLVVADPNLSQREGQAIAAWVAPPGARSEGNGGPCAPLARQIAGEFGVDIVVFALFAQAGMLLDLHVRSGGLLRTWRIPIDTIWGDAARQGSAFVLGELHRHAGAESLASLGMGSAGIAGLENGNGLAAGALGIAARDADAIDTDTARALLDRAPLLGAQIMALRSQTLVPVADSAGTVELESFAARVGCRRFALYAREGNHLRLVSAHDASGKVTSPMTDSFEEQLVCWAAEKGIAVVSEDAAAVVVGETTVLYAADPKRRPMDALRLALQDLRHHPFGSGTIDFGDEQQAA
jgi:hypothetical protein